MDQANWFKNCAKMNKKMNVKAANDGMEKKIYACF